MEKKKGTQKEEGRCFCQMCQTPSSLPQWIFSFLSVGSSHLANAGSYGGVKTQLLRSPLGYLLHLGRNQPARI